MRKFGLMIFLLLGACASGSTYRPLRAYEIATAPYHEGGSESFVGSMMYESGCLLFDGEDGNRLLPIWPSSSTFEESLITFHQPAKADQRIVLGEEIRLDGVASEWAALPPDFGRFEHQCGAKPFFVSGLAPAN